MRAAVEALFSHTWEYAQEVLGWTLDNLDLVVPHQVGTDIDRPTCTQSLVSTWV